MWKACSISGVFRSCPIKFQHVFNPNSLQVAMSGLIGMHHDFWGVFCYQVCFNETVQGQVITAPWIWNKLFLPYLESGAREVWYGVCVITVMCAFKNYTSQKSRLPGQWFCTVRLYWTRETWAIEINFNMNHAPGAGSIIRPVDQQSSTLPLSYGCLPSAWTISL